MAQNATVIAAHLDDKDLKNSIDKLVQYVDESTKKMADSFNNRVESMRSSLQNLSNIKLDNLNAVLSNSGTNNRVKAQQAEAAAIEKTINAKDREIRKNKEAEISFDQMAAAQQKAGRGSQMSVMEQYNMQIELLKTRLRDVRQDIDIFNAAIGSGKTTQIEWGQQGLKQANAEAEKLMRIIATLENQKGNLANVVAPQGHTIQNYVNSLQKANPELALLNEQFKRGQALMQNGGLEAQKAATAITNGSNQSRQAIEMQNAAIANNVQRQREHRAEIARTGRAAQESLQQISQSIRTQLDLGTEKPIQGIKELQRALVEMRRAYFDMDTAGRESPLGQALKRDIDRANSLVTALNVYNKNLAGVSLGKNLSVDNSIGSYERLSNLVKELTTQYQRLGREERNAIKGNELADKIQTFGRAVQKIQEQMSRPISLEKALGLSERTLSDISYKIRKLQEYKRGISLADPNAQNEMSRVDANITRLNTSLNQYMGVAQRATQTNNALTRSWNYMKNRLAFYVTVGATTQFIKNLIDIRSQYEMNERALGILINSAERGTQIFKELSEMSLVSPYTLIELSSAAKQLVAYDVAAKDVVDTTRRLADMAAAVGIPIERLTYALGQIKAYGYLNSRDNRMFANAGIPLVKQLADYYTQLEGKLVSTADVYDRIKKKAVGYNDVMSVIYKMTDEGGKFFDFQAKMAETLKVRLANLTLAWNNMLNEMGQETQGLLTFGIGALRTLFANWKSIDKIFQDLLWGFGAFKAIQATALLVTGRLGSQLGWQLLIGKKLTNVFIQMGSALKTAFTNPLTYIAIVVGAVTDMVVSWHENVKAVKEFNEEIAKGAKESADSIDKYLGASTSRETRQKASTGKLSQDAGQKVWENISEQIETSSQNSAELIAKLSTIPDINERIAKSFDYLDQIRAVNMALEKLDDETLKFSKDSWHGVFGEGLASDLADYAEQMALVSKSFMEGQINKPTAIAKLQPELLEFKKELDVTTQSIKAFLDENQITAPEQVKEVLERVRAIIKQKNPEIKGELGDLFDISLDERMAELTNGAVDKNASLWRIFMEELKKSSSSAFQGLTEDIFDQTKALNEVLQPEQMRAIDDTLEKFKLKMPFFYDAVANMVKDASKLRINIGVAFGLDPNVESVYQSLTKADSAADTAWGKIQRLTKERDRLQGLGASSVKNTADMSEEDKRYAKVIGELKAAQQDYNDALEEGGQSKKENTAATKAHKAAESELQKALKEEISLIDKARSTYKTLTKEGVSSTEALDIATSGFGETIEYINSVLKKYGIARFDLTKYVGVANPREIMNMLQAQLDTLARSGVVKPAEIKDLQVKLRDLRVDSVTFSQNTLVSSLNNELGKLKDEYELAVELDADPELGSIFLDTLGISKDELSELPKTAAEVAVRAQELISKALKENEQTKNLTFDLNANLNKANLANWFKGSSIDIESDLGKGLTAWVEYVNKLRTDETKKQIQEWDKLLDKYAEYETKRKRIMDEAERERQTALRQNATQDILDAINRRMEQDLARVDFERFQQLPTWVTATGDIANLTDNALGMLIDRLQEYKKNAQNLDPKQIKQINNALSKLYREQRKDNPFTAFISAYEQAKERFNDYEVTINVIEDELDKLRKKQSAWTFEEAERFTNLTTLLKKLRKEQAAVSEVSVVDVVKGFQSMAQAVSNAVSNIKEMTDALGGSQMVNELSQVVSVFSKAGEMAAAGAQMGGAWGAAAGAALGLLSGIVTTFADEWSGNADISRQVTNSERAVRKLEQAYNQLEHTMESAYGDAVMGTQRLIVLNKEAQLYELERQIALEKSRKAKNRDEDKILDLQGEVEDLKNEINDAINEITNNLLGTSSVGDAAESMVDAMISALRNGEDALESFNGSVDDMIANVVKKFVVTRTLGPLLERTWKELETVTSRRTIPIEQEIRLLQQERADLQARYDRYYENVKGNKKDVEMLEPYRKQLEEYDQKITDAEQRLLDASMLREDDVDIMVALLERLKQEGSPVAELLETILNRVGLNGEGKTQELSSLQQGIQGITETTANALEAYMNGVLQQVYLHSTLLTEIRDFLIPQEGDIQLDVQAQMLLQLQASYQTQEAIRSMLEGWNNASGQAVRVEII